MAALCCTVSVVCLFCGLGNAKHIILPDLPLSSRYPVLIQAVPLLVRRVTCIACLAYAAVCKRTCGNAEAAHTPPVLPLYVSQHAAVAVVAYA